MKIFKRHYSRNIEEDLSLDIIITNIFIYIEINRCIYDAYMMQIILLAVALLNNEF